MKKRTDHVRRIPYQLEELDPKEIDKAYQEWMDEDDGSEDYPSLGEVLAMRFGRPKATQHRVEPTAPAAKRNSRKSTGSVSSKKRGGSR